MRQERCDPSEESESETYCHVVSPLHGESGCETPKFGQVTDSGKGINARDLEKLLEFVPGNTSKKHLGTGYGLPIAKRYVEAHGGKLTMLSEEDNGTVVTVLLPLSKSDFAP